MKATQNPVLCEPGEESLAIRADNFVLAAHNATLTLQAWDERRNLARRITGIQQEARGKLVLNVERFGKRPGALSLIDPNRRAGENVTLRGARQEFRERFRRFLRRQFPTHKIAEITTEADLEHSLSPAYPRALIRQGASAWAAIGAAADAIHVDGVLTFGLIWLDYLRRREPDLAIHGLVLFLPAGREKTTCLRLLFLNPEIAQYAAFVYTEDGVEERIDLRDYGNLDTHLEPCRGRAASGVDGELSLSLRGPEFWLELQVRDRIEQIDARLLPAPLYGQVPAFAAAHRGILDLLAIERGGRLAVLELKVSEDIHLPLQALDYWMRVKWHLDAREFSRKGYFPGIELNPAPPRILLVSPALDFHPSNERVLRFISPAVEIERVGIGLEWQRELKVMFRSPTRHAPPSTKPLQRSYRPS